MNPLEWIVAPNNTEAEEVADRQMDHFRGMRVRCVRAYTERTEGPRSGPYEVVPYAIEFENGERLDFEAIWQNTGDARLGVVWTHDKTEPVSEEDK